MHLSPKQITQSMSCGLQVLINTCLSMNEKDYKYTLAGQNSQQDCTAFQLKADHL